MTARHTVARLPPVIYRTDIDGLRALAVLSVIVYHVNEHLLPGGFAGVDIFFVISGYLITLHIVGEVDANRFSLAEFYRRRIKRIAPAMLVVVGLTFALSQCFFRPEDAERVAESSLWSLASVANVYFWLYQDTSYFAAASAEQPLLHLWSLGVEEQFYILWPLLLMLLGARRRGRAFAVLAVAVAIGSFALGQYVYPDAPSFAYYMLPTRAGELLLGALLADAVHRGWRPPNRVAVELAAWSGLGLVVGSLALLSEQRVFPGWQAVPPTLGTALLLYAGLDGRSWVSRTFQRQPLVWIGLISYSAYLIHWPILAFLRYASVPIGVVTGSCVVVVTLALAWLSYRFVEQPLRRTRRGAMAVFVRQYALPAGALMALALVAMKLDGYGPRALLGTYPERLAEVRESVRPPFVYDYVCQKPIVSDADFHDPNCVLGRSTAEQPRVLLIGDSIAAQYVGMIGAFARESGFAFTNVAASACPTLSGDPSPFITAPRVANCRTSLSAIMPVLNEYDVIIIGSAWSYYHGRSPTFFGAFEDAMAPLLTAGKRLILVTKPPLIPGYDRLCREKAIGLPFMDCRIPPVPFDADVREGNRLLAAYASRTPGVDLFDPMPVLCPDDRCTVFEQDGTPRYYDRSHLTIPASWRLGEAVIAAGGVPPMFAELGREEPDL